MSNTNQKPEKIASAVYLITSFFSDQEPLKWTLRALSSDFVSVGVSLMSQMFKEREVARLEQRSIVWEINGLLSIARNAGLVSEPNHNLISQELLKYLENLGFPAGIEEKSGSPVLSESFFGAQERTLETPKNAAAIEENFEKDNSHSKDMTYLSEREVPRYERTAPSIEKDIPRISTSSNPKPLKEFGVVSVKKNSRQSVIISLLKRKKEIMIKDVSPLIANCSEKTIQRELSAMVQSGVLKKIGEKRWSRYTLV